LSEEEEVEEVDGVVDFDASAIVDVQRFVAVHAGTVALKEETQDHEDIGDVRVFVAVGVTPHELVGDDDVRRDGNTGRRHEVPRVVEARKEKLVTGLMSSKVALHSVGLTQVTPSRGQSPASFWAYKIRATWTDA